MPLRPLKLAALLVLLAAPAVLRAQEEISSSEEQRLEALARANAEIYVPKSNVSVGFRVLSSGGKVQFGHLGSVAFDLNPAAGSAGAIERIYDNGAVHTDSPRIDERDENNVQTSTPGGRYSTYTTTTTNVYDANNNLIGTQDIQSKTGDFLSYTPGLSRSWGYGAASQVTPDGRIAMSTYSSTSEGASAVKKQGASLGVELQYVRTFSKSTSRLQWGLLTGVTMNTFNSKASGTVAATLNTRTDYYSLAPGRTAPAAPYTGPSYQDLLDSTGALISTNGYETTVPIGVVPDSSTATSIPGGVIVTGRWQVKGSYLLVRVGPSLRAQLTDRLGINASLGVAGAYAGSTYSVDETFQVPDMPDLLVGSSVGTEETVANKFVGGMFADLNFEWAANDSTGLFGGFLAQKLGDYSQTVGSRTALIDFGSAVGIRGGISIRF